MKRDYSSIIKLLNTLNELHTGIGSKPLFKFGLVDGYLRIYAMRIDLSHLFSLLWSNTINYNLYLEHDGENPYIEVI